MTTPTDEILSEIQEMTTSLEQASQILDEGTSIDLTWLERRVSAFCTQIDKLPPNDRESARLALEALYDMLDKLEADLRNRVHGLHPPSSS